MTRPTPTQAAQIAADARHAPAGRRPLIRTLGPEWQLTGRAKLAVDTHQFRYFAQRAKKLGARCVHGRGLKSFRSQAGPWLTLYAPDGSEIEVVCVDLTCLSD